MISENAYRQDAIIGRCRGSSRKKVEDKEVVVEKVKRIRGTVYGA